MQGKSWRRAGLAGVLAVTGMACAGTQRQETANPTAQAVQAQQKQSQEALNRAHDAQKKASDQEKKATEAQQDVQKAQQALIDAQRKSRSEQAKAQQLQREANDLTAQATQTARQAQQQATQSLSQQGRQVQQGQLTTAGQVVAASGDQLVIQPQNGSQPMTFRVTDRTNVTVEGQQGTLADLQQGDDARVSYQTSGTTQPEALSVDVASAPGRTPQQAGPQGAAPEGAGPQGGASPSSPYGAPGSSGGAGR